MLRSDITATRFGGDGVKIIDEGIVVEVNDERKR